MAILFVISFLAVLFLFLIKGRKGHNDLPSLQGWYYAHRGLHGPGVPENSMAAFAKAKAAGYGIELDVHLMKDGNLAVIHDSSLKRTAGKDVRIEELTASDLESYRLEGTQEKIPLLSQVLELFRGEAPLIIELKSQKDNYGALCAATCELLKDYTGTYCMESFDPRCVAWLRKHRKEIIRGQLTENFFRSQSDLPWVLKFVMRHQLLNVFTRPDFVAYRFRDRRTLSNVLVRKIWGVQMVAWTIDTQQDLEAADNEGWISIFENINP